MLYKSTTLLFETLPLIAQFFFPLHLQLIVLSMERKIRQISIFRTNLAVADPDDTDINSEILVSSVITDQDGNETERITYDIDGNPEERVLISYKNGKPVEEILEMGGEQAERTTREFDSNGKLVKEFRHYLDGEPDQIAYEYDAEGHLVMRLLTDSDGEEGEKHLWIYDNKLLKREESTNEFGSLEFSKTYSYDENGTLEEVVELNLTGDEQTRLVTVFNEAGKVETDKRYDARGRLVARNIYTYDESGNNTSVEEETVSGKTLITLHYDDEGNNILQEENGPDGSIGSRIQRTFSGQGQPQTTEVRMENTARRMGQHYRLRYEYLYFGQEASQQ